jgi:adenine phosphoribosyltransferase
MNRATREPSSSGRTVAEFIQCVPVFDGFPKPGVAFQDLSAVYSTPELLRELTNLVVEHYRGEFTHVAGVEARGFLFGMAVAWVSSAPLVLVRKAGKLPGPVHQRTYESEYAIETIESQDGVIDASARILLVDDVLATGETLKAAAGLIEGAGAEIGGMAVLLELAAQGGRTALGRYPLYAIHSLDREQA